MKQVLPWLWSKIRVASLGIKRGSEALCRFLFPTTPRDKGWLSWKLYPSTLILFSLLEIGLIVTVEVLLRLSRAHQGFVTVNVPNPASVSKSFFRRSHWTESYLWTTVPTFIMSLYKLLWTSVISDFTNRQPFIELAKERGSTGRRTVLLDYRSYSAFVSWYHAFRNRHTVLGVTILASFFSLLLPSLVSNLFSVAAIPRASAANMSVTTFFNDSAVDSKTNYQTVFSIISAARIYNASFPPWTTENYSFPTFEPERGFQGLVNGSLKVTGYSAGLDCRSMTEYDHSITDRSVVVFNTTDRGCPIEVHVPIAPGATVYVKTNYVGNCDSSVGLRRHAFVAGVVDNSSSILLTNFSFISCTMEYFQTPGTLIVGFGIAQTPSIVSFTKGNNHTTWLPTLWDRLEFMIHQIVQFDPTATYSSNNLGLLILAYSERLVGSSNRLDTTAMIQAVQDIFASIFAVSSSIYLFQPLEAPGSPLSGQLYSFINRLFVVASTARLLQGILAFLTVWMIVLMIYSFVKGSILKEEPKGLLGIAELAQNGSCGTIAAAFRNAATPDDFEKFVEAEEYNDKIFRTQYDTPRGRPQIICDEMLPRPDVYREEANDGIDQNLPTGLAPH
ncbi:hypothetical protein BKA61DRAFT_190077 [Leptodontidium sp. MPI-SDFR-AT-0119]|nr:hypothetical protein BKA61DRAFT_190077 [Leptodontidium sp. MPI-SDFR-AT-0119]